MQPDERSFRARARGVAHPLGQAGAVFAAQVSYLVTAFGVIWAKFLLNETYSAWIWLAMAVIFVGLFLVQPRPKTALARPGGTGKDAL